jgi:TonB-linked SusC/RagA family outer membrane protein
MKEKLEIPIRKWRLAEMHTCAFQAAKTKCMAFLLCAVFLCCSISVFAQNGTTVKGRIVDTHGEGLPGAIISVVGSTRGSAADDNGYFELPSIIVGTKLLVSYLGMEDQVITFSGKSDLIIVMEEKANELEGVTIVAFGKQKKESVVSAIQTVNVGELRVPSSNLTTALAGRMAGLISYQTSGEPGMSSNADFFIRGVPSFGTGKVDPLILIDNMEISKDDMAKLHPDDLQSFSILKDATATALYGARGANGVILMTTKEGQEGKVSLKVRLENTWSAPTRNIEMADPITYMEMANEAISTRLPYPMSVYSRGKIEDTRAGVNPYVFPAVDWMKLLIKDVTANQRANMSISGGGKVARYYVSGSFAQDKGLLKADKRNNFDNNVDYKQYTLHSNVNVNVTSSTAMTIRLHGGFSDYQGPTEGGSDLYQSILKVSPVRFPAYFEPDRSFANAGHILFGNQNSPSSVMYLNPYAQMLKGYKQSATSQLMAQLELNQDFSKWLEGLTGRVLGNTTRNSGFDLTRSYTPFYYEAGAYNRLENTYSLIELNSTLGKPYLSYGAGDKSVSNIMYGEASLAYARTFGVHDVSGMLVAIGRNSLDGGADTLIKALPNRNLGLSGRFTYGYDGRYMGEFNFGYNGSEKFDKGHHWGFFPSIGAAWVVSNEKFWTDLKDKVSLLKFRYTYGLVGNDAIGEQRFFYLSNISLHHTDGGHFVAGSNYMGFGTTVTGDRKDTYVISSYANPDIGWEIAYKHNLGVELGLFGKLNVLVDIYKEHRINILQARADVPISMGLWDTPLVNLGEANSRGIDIAVDYNHQINKDWWIIGRGNFTFAHSEYEVYEESDYAQIGIPWRSKVGRATTQAEGYIAERLFIDQADIDNSPRQDFGVYMPGDIKYKDISGDGLIDERDMVAIGYPKTPEISYGFGFTAGYKSFDISAFFSGSARSSFFIDAKKMAPFTLEIPDQKDYFVENGLAKFIADDYWTETTQNPYAAWPRLAYNSADFQNNVLQSTYWMRDNSYLRFKQLEIGYTFPEQLVKKMRLSSLRFYLSGTNLLLFSNFKIWDIELGGNGLNYPLQRTINAGVNLSF